MRRALHHGARDGDRVQVPHERRDRPDAMRRPVDDRGVQLDDAQDVRLAAAADARVRRIRLDDACAGLDGVERVAPAAEEAHPDGERARSIAARDDGQRRGALPPGPRGNSH